MSLVGQVAIVTGASRGLGHHLALALSEAGVQVALGARSTQELSQVADEINQKGGRAIAVATDVTKAADVAELVRHTRGSLGSVDILINNAGVGWYKPFVEWSIAEIDATLDVNLKGTLYACREVLPEMLERGRGQIVNVASDLARRPLPNMAPYVAAKHGVLGFSGSLLREVKGRGVKVMTLTPGIIDTYFAGGTEGSRDPSWSMSPRFVADFVVHLLRFPGTWTADEVSIHPLGQDF